MSGVSFVERRNVVHCSFDKCHLFGVRGIMLMDVAGLPAILSHDEMRVGCTAYSYEVWERSKENHYDIFESVPERHATIALIRAAMRVIRLGNKRMKKEYGVK